MIDCSLEATIALGYARVKGRKGGGWTLEFPLLMLSSKRESATHVVTGHRGSFRGASGERAK